MPHAHWSAAADITPRTPFSGNIVDPECNWVLELHSYLDPDDTGTYREPVKSSTIGAERLEGAIAWSRQRGVRLFLGETGAPPDATGLAAFRTMLGEISASPDVFWGVAVWGAGAWWKPDYPMRLNPIAGVDRPRFVALEDGDDASGGAHVAAAGQQSPAVVIRRLRLRGILDDRGDSVWP